MNYYVQDQGIGHSNMHINILFMLASLLPFISFLLGESAKISKAKCVSKNKACIVKQK